MAQHALIHVAFRNEIDGWIALNECEADAAHRAFLAGRAALGQP
jgi:hypothetical protein